MIASHPSTKEMTPMSEKLILTSSNATSVKHYVSGKSTDGFAWTTVQAQARRFRDRAEIAGWLANLRWGDPGPCQLKGHSGIGLSVERCSS